MCCEVIGHPSMTTMEAGYGSLCKDIFWEKANSLSMKQELAIVSRMAKT
jgi:hypothetical protein